MKIHNIDNVNIPFETHWQSIAISVSGGADSALLSYLLCSLIPSTQTMEVNIISHIRMWKTRPWQAVDSLQVFNWLQVKFPNLKFKRHTNFIAPDIEYGNIGPSITDEYNKQVSGDNIQQRAFAEYVCHIEKCDAYYNAVTRNPRVEHLNGMQERNIEPNTTNQHLTLMIHMGRYAIHPFRFVEKDWVIRQYKRLGLESLLTITRSCEGEFKGIDYMTYTPGQFVPVCGECFWCKEREWAVNESK